MRYWGLHKTKVPNGSHFNDSTVDTAVLRNNLADCRWSISLSRIFSQKRFNLVPNFDRLATSTGIFRVIFLKTRFVVVATISLVRNNTLFSVVHAMPSSMSRTNADFLRNPFPLICAPLRHYFINFVVVGRMIKHRHRSLEKLPAFKSHRDQGDKVKVAVLNSLKKFPSFFAGIFSSGWNKTGKFYSFSEKNKIFFPELEAKFPAFHGNIPWSKRWLLFRLSKQGISFERIILLTFGFVPTRCVCRRSNRLLSTFAFIFPSAPNKN